MVLALCLFLIHKAMILKKQYTKIIQSMQQQPSTLLLIVPELEEQAYKISILLYVPKVKTLVLQYMIHMDRLVYFTACLQGRVHLVKIQRQEVLSSSLQNISICYRKIRKKSVIDAHYQCYHFQNSSTQKDDFIGSLYELKSVLHLLVNKNMEKYKLVQKKLKMQIKTQQIIKFL